ncbi:hypothetical protein OCU04_004754 [Sclerotinia nivalis]|uniref:Uncharacterized protein n=1 Tax=Sclerotinia nivalis TaxID=352851 RepID=A0A9X0AS04_9HELO|nr:hypothetical protein OCU04_004754 [Sclerotinia nivalis]
MFMVPNRSFGTGMTVPAIFPNWTLINEIGFSAIYTYKRSIALLTWWTSGPVVYPCEIVAKSRSAPNNCSTYFRPVIACLDILHMISTLLWPAQTKLPAMLVLILGYLRRIFLGDGWMDE